MGNLEKGLTELGAMLNRLAIKVDENFNKIEVRLGKIEDRLDRIEDRMDRMEDRMDKIENKLNVLTDETSTNFKEVGNRLVSIEAEIAKIGAATRYEQHHEDQKRFSVK